MSKNGFLQRGVTASPQTFKIGESVFIRVDKRGIKILAPKSTKIDRIGQFPSPDLCLETEKIRESKATLRSCVVCFNPVCTCGGNYENNK